jgi:hypothetical protein
VFVYTYIYLHAYIIIGETEDEDYFDEEEMVQNSLNISNGDKVS